MLFALMFCLVMFSDDSKYVLWLTNNQRMVLKGPPVCSGPRCSVTLLNGQVTSLPSKLLDMERSKTFNEELAQKQEEKRLAAEATAQRLVEAEAKEVEANKARHLVITPDTKLPKFDPSFYTGTESLDGAVDPNQVGEPETTTFKSKNDVYVASEVLTRFKDHYTIKCDVKVASTGSVTNLKVNLKVNFANAATQQLKQTLPGPFAAGSVATLNFSIPESDDIIRVSYKVEATSVTISYE